MPQTRKANRRPPILDAAIESRVGWFMLLDLAKERNDFEAAARAVRELRRRGVEVRYLPERGEVDHVVA